MHKQLECRAETAIKGTEHTANAEEGKVLCR